MDADRERKAALRTSARRARASLEPEERQVAGQAIVARVLRLPEVLRASTVLVYAATPEEPDPAALVPALTHRGARILLPRVRGDELQLVATRDLATLALGYRGIREPAGPAIDPLVVSVALVPGVAFDLAGGRLGQGGGHYDRLLADLPTDCLRVGLAFACQLVPRVPREEHDQPVDVVVTEHVTHRTGARRDPRPS